MQPPQQCDPLPVWVRLCADVQVVSFVHEYFALPPTPQLRAADDTTVWYQRHSTHSHKSLDISLSYYSDLHIGDLWQLERWINVCVQLAGGVMD